MPLYFDDMARELVTFTHQQPADANVADLVWLGPCGLRELDAHVATLAREAPADVTPAFEHAAFVLPDGWLFLCLITERGAFAFRVRPGDWGWVQRPA
jgi:hypothetical protein